MKIITAIFLYYIDFTGFSVTTIESMGILGNLVIRGKRILKFAPFPLVY